MWHLHACFVVDMRIAVELGAWLVEQQFHDHRVDARHCWPVERVWVEATCREGKDFLVGVRLLILKSMLAWIRKSLCT